jgi:selenocysteine-specific elongation factor
MQKFILRDQPAKRTLGGGSVLDPLPPARQNKAMRSALLETLRAADAATAFARMMSASVGGFDLDIFVRSWNLTASECQALLAIHPAKVFHDGNAKIALHADHWQALLDRIVELLGAHHRNHPELLGLAETGVHAALRPPVTKSLVGRAVAELCGSGIAARRGIIVHLSAHQAQPTPAEAALWKRVAPALAANGVRPPRLLELVDRVPIAIAPLEAFLARAEQLGWVHQVAKNRYFLPATLDELERIAEQLAGEYPHGTFSAADFNRVSGIGRNLSIQVLEYFDRIGITQRQGDRRNLRSAVAGNGPS